jgi:hypothetical protein
MLNDLGDMLHARRTPNAARHPQSGVQPTTHPYSDGLYDEAMLTMRFAWPDENVYMQESKL